MHNDIKPQNFVVKKFDPRHGNPYRIYLTDFGLAEKKGGTPVFASPECFEDPEQKRNSDIFSLGRVFLYIILGKVDFFLWVYMPVDNQLKTKMDQIIQNDPILKLISNMTKVENRFNIKSVRKNFDLIQPNSYLKFSKTTKVTVEASIIKQINSEFIKSFRENYTEELYNLSYVIIKYIIN